MRRNLGVLAGIGIAAIGIIVGVLGVNTSSVQAANGLTISPLLKEITLGPGLIQTSTEITLQNNTGEPVSAQMQLVDLKALGEYGGSSLDKAGLTDKYDLANWMTLPNGDTVKIASGDTVKIKVNISNRDDLAPGGHYGAVVVTTTPATSARSNVNINQQLVSLLFVKKLGGEVYGLQPEPLTYDGPGIPQQITTRFKSTGNVHVVPRGFIEVTDPAGKQVAKGIINEDSSIILPGSTRQFVTLMQPVSDSNKPGRYKITVNYRYDGEERFSTQSTYFTRGHPVTALVVGVITILAMIGSITYVLFRIKRKKHPKVVSAKK